MFGIRGLGPHFFDKDFIPKALCGCDILGGFSQPDLVAVYVNCHENLASGTLPLGENLRKFYSCRKHRIDITAIQFQGV